WFGVRRWRNLGASLELFAPERAANRGIPIVQAHIAPQVAGADCNLYGGVLTSRFDIVVAGAEPDAVGVADQMLVSLWRRNRRIIAIDDDIAGIVELSGGIGLLSPAAIELRLATQEPDDRLGRVDPVGSVACRTNPIVTRF